MLFSVVDLYIVVTFTVEGGKLYMGVSFVQLIIFTIAMTITVVI